MCQSARRHPVHLILPLFVLFFSSSLFSFPLRFFPHIFPIPLIFYISFFHSLCSSSPHVTSSLQFPVSLSTSYSCSSFHLSVSLGHHILILPYTLNITTHRTLVCKRSRLRVPAVYNRSRKLLVVAQLQQTSFTYRSPTNGASNYSVFGVSVT